MVITKEKKKDQTSKKNRQIYIKTNLIANLLSRINTQEILLFKTNYQNNNKARIRLNYIY
jgi:hypothetical protein